MSVYQYDVIRCDKDLALKILTATDIKPDFITKMYDDSIYLSWETWHGSPFPDFEYLLTQDVPYLYGGENEGLEAWCELSSLAPKHWEDEVCVTDEGFDFIKHGTKISLDELKEMES